MGLEQQQENFFVDKVVSDQDARFKELSDRLAFLETQEAPRQSIVTLYDNTLSVNGAWDVQNSNLIAGVGNFADYDLIEVYLYAITGTVLAISDVIWLLFGTGGGALDATAANYSRETLAAAGAVVAAASGDDPLIAFIAAASSSANMLTDLKIKIFSPGGATHKNAITTSGSRFDAATHGIRSTTLSWENTGAITRIGIRTDNHPTDLITAGGRLVIRGHRF